MDSTREIGSRLELFVDDWLIENMSGVGLKLHQPVRREIAHAFDRPWEGPTSSYVTVMKDGDLYRMWHRASNQESDRKARTGYAESDDGIHWRRPDLGIIDFEGSTRNNLVMDSSTVQDLCVCKDGNPGTPDSERYKAVGTLRSPETGQWALHGFTSPDGVRWSPLDRNPILTEGPFDTQTVPLWDVVRGEYVVYTRGVAGAEGSFKGGVRWIRRATSPDFRNWTRLEPIDAGNTPFEHLYTNACTQYFRAPHIYLMFPRRFVPERKFFPKWINTGISEGVFMSSRDGLHWDRRFMEAFFRPGPDPDNWTDRNQTAALGVVPTSPTELSIYYGEHFRHSTNRMRRTTIRTDGFVSVNAPYGGGEFLTRPLTFLGSQLVINYATSVAGGLQVEIQDAEGRPLDGYRLSDCPQIFGDEIERPVAWSSGDDLSALTGRPARLRFVMKEADLYSIRFRKAD